MCTIVLAWGCVGGAGYVIAANRDELVARPSAPPQLLCSDPPIAGGRDLRAGGTWLAVAADGRVCAVTNRRAGAGDEVARDPSRRSRGEIPLKVLAHAEDDVPAFLTALGMAPYNPVNVLYVSPSLAITASMDDSGRRQLAVLERGVHVLTVGDVDDPSRAKDARLRSRVEQALAAAADGADLERRFRTVLSSHDSATEDPRDAACIHGEMYGTVSSATVLATDGETLYRHAQGRPCVTPFELVDALDRAA